MATSGSNRPPSGSYRKKSKVRNRPLKTDSSYKKAKVWNVHPPTTYDDKQGGLIHVAL